MSQIFKVSKVTNWIRKVVTNLQKRSSLIFVHANWKSGSSSSSGNNKTSSATTNDIEESLMYPPVIPRRKKVLNQGRNKTKRSVNEVTPDDNWTTVYSNMDDFSPNSDEDSDFEGTPLINQPKIPSRYLKRANGTTNLLSPVKSSTPTVTLLHEFPNFDVDDNYSATLEYAKAVGGPNRAAAILEDVPLKEMQSSSYLMKIAGISKSDLDYDDSSQDVFPSSGGAIGSIDDDERMLIETDSSDASIINYMQRKYEKRAKYRLKYEALQRLNLRVKWRLLRSRDDRTPSSSSYTSLTSDGGDFRLNLPKKFYQRIGVTSRRADKEQRDKAYAKNFFQQTVKQIKEDPAMYAVKGISRSSFWWKSKRETKYKKMT